MLTKNTLILPKLTPWRKSKMLGYAEQVLSTQQRMMTDKGKNILHYTLQKKRRHIFTVNRWVTPEIWYDALYNPKFIKRFKMSLSDDPYRQILDQWIEAVLHLFSPKIAWLHEQRDNETNQYVLQNPGNNVYEDQHIEELSELSIDLKSQIQWILGVPG